MAALTLELMRDCARLMKACSGATPDFVIVDPKTAEEIERMFCPVVVRTVEE